MPATVVQIHKSPDWAAEVHRAAELLRAGKIVVLPTETVYGATVQLGSAAGRERLSALRRQETPKPLTPHLLDREQASQFLGPISRLADRMMRKLWPGPVGLQFEVEPARRREVVQSLGVAETELYQDGWITLRCPDHPVFTEVAAAAGPLAAMAVGEPGRFDAAELAAELDGKVELIFDAGPPRFSKPSTLVKIDGQEYRVVRTGVYDERTIRRLLKTTILFVCSGNTCRSPMAEAIARKILTDRLGEELEKHGIEVLSAGSMAMPGFRATEEASEAVKAFGGDLSRHRSRPLTIELVNQADVIYTMSRDHRRAVMSLVPSAEAKILMLDPHKDVEDPIGSDATVYNELAGELHELIDARLKERPLP
jgi:protein-tyrosine phosphatase